MKRVEQKPVSRAAVIKRINRVLAKEHLMLRVTRGKHWPLVDFGKYCVWKMNDDLPRAPIHAVDSLRRIDLEKYARELGVLSDQEYVASSGS